MNNDQVVIMKTRKVLSFDSNNYNLLSIGILRCAECES